MFQKSQGVEVIKFERFSVEPATTVELQGKARKRKQGGKKSNKRRGKKGDQDNGGESLASEAYQVRKRPIHKNPFLGPDKSGASFRCRQPSVLFSSPSFFCLYTISPPPPSGRGKKRE